MTDRPGPAVVEKAQDKADQKDDIQSKTTADLWDQIGFHKPMAGFWFNITYTIIAIAASAVLMGYLMSTFYPYPESMGYRDIAFNLFGFLFLLFDVATGAVMSRFIPEVNIRDPEKLLHYIQYFIFYQMTSGLIQTTLVSIYALYFVPSSTLAYVTWLMLICSTTQYPGFLSAFSNVLDALQQHHKAQTSRFFSSTVVQRIIEIGFIVLGRLYGASNPAVGEILGISIGAAIGLYVAQFTAMLISAYFFTGIMRIYGIKVRDCFRREFTWQEVKPALVYAVKTSIPGIVNGGLNYLNLLLWITYFPQYTSVIVFQAIGGSIADTMDWFGVPAITPLVAESYMNGKPQLTQYYIGQLARFNALLHGFFLPLIILLAMVMTNAWLALGMINYLPGIAFIIPRMIKLVLNKYNGIPGQVLYGADRPNIQVALGLTQSFTNFGMLSVYLVLLKLPVLLGISGMAWVMELGWMPFDITFSTLAYTYIHKKLVKVKFPVAQIAIGIVIPSGLTLAVLMIGKLLVYDTLYSMGGFFLAAFPSIGMVAILLFFMYFPLTGALGGWDSTNLAEFKKVSRMSGPSKWIVIPVYKILEATCKHSKLHGRFAMPVEGVIKEAEELLVLKTTKREEFKQRRR
ncbi:MAG: hypothetical protein Q6370_002540 [Candidatus Sigynarchaeota archaeon]